MSKYQQLAIWDVLDEIAESAPNAPLRPVWDCLDSELKNLPVEIQLAAVSIAFHQIAQILKERATGLLQDVSDSGNPDRPCVKITLKAAREGSLLHLYSPKFLRLSKS